jgi:hypothetical protein
MVITGAAPAGAAGTAVRGLMRRAVVVTGAVVVVLVAMAGVAGATGTVVLAWSPSGTVSYGTLSPLATSPPRAFKLTNNGTSATSALKITVAPSSGTPMSAFTKTADTCTGTSLGPKKSCSVSVTFTAPATPGSYGATLTAVSNKPAATATVMLTGMSGKATPAITTTQQPATGTVGDQVTDQATVTGGNSPTGTVTFNLYDNPSCGGTPLFTSTAEPLVGGMATASAGTATAALSGYWVARYNGDTNNNAVTSGCADEPVTINKAQPAITTAPQPGGALPGSAIADQATVTGGFVPSGTVTFSLYNNPNCGGTPLFTDTQTLFGGVATSNSYTVTATGTDYWTASYNGDFANLTATTGCGEPVIISTCVVTDTSTSQSFADLPDAVAAAAADDTLTVQGTCTGITEIGKNLTLTGQPSGSQAPTLDGGGQGSVLTIDSGITVTVNTLTITGGGGGLIGGGIYNAGGTLNVNNSTITGNSGGSFGAGGGIINAIITATSVDDGGPVTLTDSTVSNNTTTVGAGGGIYNVGATVTLNGTSTVSNNTAGEAGGIVSSGFGTVTLNNTSSVDHNSARIYGGIENDSSTVTLNGSSTVSNNTATADDAGGIFTDSGTVTMNGSSSITGNSAAFRGGGIYNANMSTVTMNDSSTITGNSAGNDGGGIFNECPTTLNGAVDGGNVNTNTPNNIANPTC